MRIRELDVIRGIAILLVLVYHRPALYYTGWAGKSLVTFGWAGVHLFFVMSGYLVTGLLLSEQERHGEVRFLRFLVRRGMKIYPQFYFLMAVAIIGPWLAGYELPWRRYLAELFFVQNYFTGYWGFTWSLAVEEHFYLIIAVATWSWARALGWRGRLRWTLPAFLIALILVGVGSRCIYAGLGLYQVSEGYVNGYTHFQIDVLAAGGLLCWCVRTKSEALRAFSRRWRWGLFLLALALLAPLTVHARGSVWVFLWGYPLVTLGYVAIHLVAIYNPLPSAGVAGKIVGPPAALLAFMGRHCYGTFLWQIPVSYMVMPHVMRLLSPGPLSEVIWFCAISTAVGFLTGTLIEAPALKLREKLAPSRSGSLTAPVAQKVRELRSVGSEGAAAGGAGGIRTRE